jgi:putative endonuclease
MTTMKAIWSVYIIRTLDDRLYSGVTTDVVRRFREHLTGGPRAAKYLRAHPPEALVFVMPIGARSLAHKVEYHLKRLPRERKEDVIRRQRIVFDADSGRIAA